MGEGWLESFPNFVPPRISDGLIKAAGLWPCSGALCWSHARESCAGVMHGSHAWESSAGVMHASHPRESCMGVM